MEMPITDLLTADQEIDLAAQIEAGLYASRLLTEPGGNSPATRAELAVIERSGREAWQRFLLGNLRLVALIAGQEARRTGVAAADLFQEGFVGLAQALARYDYRRGLRFGPYAATWIRSQVRTAAATDFSRDLLRPRGAAQVHALRKAEGRLAQSLGRRPTVGDIAADLELGVEVVIRLREHQVPTLIADTSELERADRRALEAFDACDRSADVARLLAALTAEERRVMTLRFGIGRPATSYAALAELLGTSASSVRRIEQRALARLRGLYLDDPLAA